MFKQEKTKALSEFCLKVNYECYVLSAFNKRRLFRSEKSATFPLN